MKALYTMACGTKSDHVGAAEGKTSEQRTQAMRRAVSPSSAAGPAGLWSQPQPSFTQAHLCISSQPRGLRVIPQSQELKS